MCEIWHTPEANRVCCDCRFDGRLLPDLGPPQMAGFFAVQTCLERIVRPRVQILASGHSPPVGSDPTLPVAVPSTGLFLATEAFSSHARARGFGPTLSFSQNPCYPRGDECGDEAARAS
jgi:hypothetical protein